MDLGLEKASKLAKSSNIKQILCLGKLRKIIDAECFDGMVYFVLKGKYGNVYISCKENERLWYQNLESNKSPSNIAGKPTIDKKGYGQGK